MYLCSLEAVISYYEQTMVGLSLQAQILKLNIVKGLQAVLYSTTAHALQGRRCPENPQYSFDMHGEIV